jgi:hypothetical protein
MPQELTKQDILELFKESDRRFTRAMEESRRELEKELQKSRKEFELRAKKLDQQIGNLTGSWGDFVEELIRPKTLDIFSKNGIEVTSIARNVEVFKNNQRYYEIDMLLDNKKYALAIEVKSTITVEYVNDHLERLKKIQEYPPSDLHGKIVLGAIAGIMVKASADRYAERKGLYVLRQKGNIVEIVNDKDFVAREWKVE